MQAPQKGDKIAIVHTSMGDMKIKLFPNEAPKAVENFETHAKNGYYDNIEIFRVVEDFVIQTGSPDNTNTGGKSIWGEPFEDEFSTKLHNLRGALSMANSGSNSNGSQFFIVQAKSLQTGIYDAMKQADSAYGFTEDVLKAYQENGGTPHLDRKHTVFGQLYEGLDVLDKIAAVAVDENSRPIDAVIIQSIEITEFGG